MEAPIRINDDPKILTEFLSYINLSLSSWPCSRPYPNPIIAKNSTNFKDSTSERFLSVWNIPYGLIYSKSLSIHWPNHLFSVHHHPYAFLLNLYFVSLQLSFYGIIFPWQTPKVVEASSLMTVLLIASSFIWV